MFDHNDTNGIGLEEEIFFAGSPFSHVKEIETFEITA
jgi:hypothetical protein